MSSQCQAHHALSWKVKLRRTILIKEFGVWSHCGVSKTTFCDLRFKWCTSLAATRKRLQTWNDLRSKREEASSSCATTKGLGMPRFIPKSCTNHLDESIWTDPFLLIATLVLKYPIIAPHKSLDQGNEGIPVIIWQHATFCGGSMSECSSLLWVGIQVTSAKIAFSFIHSSGWIVIPLLSSAARPRSACSTPMKKGAGLWWEAQWRKAWNSEMFFFSWSWI